MSNFTADLSPWLTMAFDRAWLEAHCEWKEFGNGSRMGKLKRDAGTGLVLYHVEAGAPDSVFAAHTHTGGEMYLVLEGETYDDAGVYPKGSLVWMKPGSRHTPKTRGDTWILTLWPDGVKS